MCVCVRAFCVCECVFLLYPSSHSLYLCFVFSMSITSLHLILATLYCSCSFALAIFGWITSISIVMSSLVMKIQKLCAIIYWNIIEVDSLSNSIMTKSNFKMYNFFACTFSHWSGKNEREKKRLNEQTHENNDFKSFKSYGFHTSMISIHNTRYVAIRRQGATNICCLVRYKAMMKS